MAFAHRPGDTLGTVDGPRPTKADPVYDEVAAKRVERELVDLAEHFTKSLLAIDELRPQLRNEKCAELFGRIKQSVHEAEGDLARLMAEAHKQVRGE